MPKLTITLSAVEHALAKAWERWCNDLPFVKVQQGSIFDAPADAIVSPANSFGFMDGGIDRLYMERFGDVIQARVQERIGADHAGELVVGNATIVETNDDDFPYLIAAPTMRVPLVLNSSIHPYLAARATFLLIRDGVFPSGENAGAPIREVVSSVAIPGLGTGVGCVPPIQCAKQVRAAIEDIVLEKYVVPTRTLQIRKRHDKLIGKP